ncbi:uncharacterized protein LOC143449708 [Clavelina lepadiformis]|uniref:uncharacterized protein LOC143449708 n=1 Tax=Clavelina lepadiformis TaxID=159417 RepID=UPI004042B49C
MEGLVSFTLEIVGWMLCNILEMNFVTALLSRLMLKRFDNYNEEKKKELLVRFTSLLFVLKVAYSTIVFFMLTDHKIRKSHNIWGYYDFYKWILVMIVSYCFADILIHLIWKVKRKPWQYLHHIYGIGFGSFVILLNATLLSSASFNLMPDVFAPFTGLLALIGFGINEDKSYWEVTVVGLGAYIVFQACSIPIHYCRFSFKEHDLDDESLSNYTMYGMLLDFAIFYSFVTICLIYWINFTVKEENARKKSEGLRVKARDYGLFISSKGKSQQTKE